MRCARCGHENEAPANFCSSCGASLGDADETTASLGLLEDRQELEAQLGDLLSELPADTGLLVVRRGPNAGSTFALDTDGTSIGRHPDSDLFLDDVTVSRRHAVVRHLVGRAGDRAVHRIRTRRHRMPQERARQWRRNALFGSWPVPPIRQRGVQPSFLPSLS